jgi:hypothetical protein
LSGVESAGAYGWCGCDNGARIFEALRGAEPRGRSRSPGACSSFGQSPAPRSGSHRSAGLSSPRGRGVGDGRLVCRAEPQRGGFALRQLSIRPRPRRQRLHTWIARFASRRTTSSLTNVGSYRACWTDSSRQKKPVRRLRPPARMSGRTYSGTLRSRRPARHRAPDSRGRTGRGEPRCRPSSRCGRLSRTHPGSWPQELARASAG